MLLLPCNPGFNFTCTSCTICYPATQTAEIFHILQLFLAYHSLYWGWLPSDSHYLSFFCFFSRSFPFHNVSQVQLPYQSNPVAPFLRQPVAQIHPRIWQCSLRVLFWRLLVTYSSHICYVMRTVLITFTDSTSNFTCSRRPQSHQSNATRTLTVWRQCMMLTASTWRWVRLSQPHFLKHQSDSHAFQITVPITTVYWQLEARAVLFRYERWQKAVKSVSSEIREGVWTNCWPKPKSCREDGACFAGRQAARGVLSSSGTSRTLISNERRAICWLDVHSERHETTWRVHSQWGVPFVGCMCSPNGTRQHDAFTANFTALRTLFCHKATETKYRDVNNVTKWNHTRRKYKQRAST